MSRAHDFSRRDFSRCLRADVVGNRRGKNRRTLSHEHTIFRDAIFPDACARTWWKIGGGKKNATHFLDGVFFGCLLRTWWELKQSARSDAGHGQGRPALERPYEMRRPHERLMELCSLCRHRRPPEYPPSALSATAGPSSRPASASSSRWRSPGVLIWIFDSGRSLAYVAQRRSGAQVRGKQGG